MSKINIPLLKTSFQTGDIPTQGDFINLIDTLNNAGNNVIVVSTLGDFPTPVLNVITLEASKKYYIDGLVNIGINRIVTNGAILFGSSLVIDGLIYTGTGIMLTVDNVNFQSDNLLYICTTAGATFINQTGDITQFVLFNMSLVFCDSFGNLSGFNIYEWNQSAISCITQGMTFSGACGSVTLSVTGFTGFTGSGTYMNFGTATFFLVNIDLTQGILAAGETFISGLPAGANFSQGLSVVGSFFDTSGGGDILNGITVNDLRVNFFRNPGLEDTNPKSTLYISTSATTAITQDTPVLVAGTWTTVAAQRFTNTASGRVTYNGLETRDFFISARLNANVVSGNGNDFNFFIAINGLVTSQESILSKLTISLDNNNPIPLSIATDAKLKTNDFIEIFCENTSNDIDIVIEISNLIIA